jgi:hypothetical protein
MALISITNSYSAYSKCKQTKENNFNYLNIIDQSLIKETIQINSLTVGLSVQKQTQHAKVAGLSVKKPPQSSLFAGLSVKKPPQSSLFAGLSVKKPPYA